MATYRIQRLQKIFTRAEKEAIREILRRTKGLREIPITDKNTTRDVIRGRQLIKSYNNWITGNGKLSKEEIESAKIFLRNSGLGKSADVIDKVLEKYSNKRLLARWQRMQNHKGIPMNSSNFTKAEIRHRKSFFDEYHEANDKIRISKGSVIDKKDIPLYKGLKKDENKLGLTQISTKNRKTGSITVCMDETHKPTNYDMDINEFYDTRENGLSKKKLRDLRKVYDGDKKTNGLITVSRNAKPETISHEIGHYKTYQGPAGDVRRMPSDNVNIGWNKNRNANKHRHVQNLNTDAQTLGKSLGEIANEASASAHGRALLKKHGANPKRIEEAKKHMDTALSTYTNDNFYRYMNDRHKPWG